MAVSHCGDNLIAAKNGNTVRCASTVRYASMFAKKYLFWVRSTYWYGTFYVKPAVVNDDSCNRAHTIKNIQYSTSC